MAAGGLAPPLGAYSKTVDYRMLKPLSNCKEGEGGMLRRYFIKQMLGALPLVCGSTPPVTLDQRTPVQLRREDGALITEAFNLWKQLGEKIWAGWTKIPMPLLYITDEWEYAIGFPKAMQSFQPLKHNTELTWDIQTRGRVLSPELSASFDIQGVNAVVIGTPYALKKSPGAWAITAAHEMFHVLQSARGSVRKVRALKLGPETDASWQLNFPFPYNDADVMRLIHLQGYPIYLGITDTEEADIKYNTGTAVEAIQVYRSFLKSQAPDERFYWYSQFQETIEGIGRYTEYKMAEAAADSGYQPTEAFRRISDFKGYKQVWEESYKNQLFPIKHAGRAMRSRTTFYYLGLGKGLLLDRIMPDWKARYFAPDVWLDGLLTAALG